MPAGPGYDARYHGAWLKDLEKEAGRDLGGQARAALEREVLAVRRFYDEVRPPGLPLAIFSCRPAAIWDARRLPENARPELHIDDHFHTGQLEDQLRRHPPGLVAVVEKESARLFTVVLEDVQEVDRFRTPARASEPRSTRNASAEVFWLLQKLPALRRRGYEALYLAGPEAAVGTLKKELPEPLRRDVRAELHVTLDVSPGELADQLRRELASASSRRT